MELAQAALRRGRQGRILDLARRLAGVHHVIAVMGGVRFALWHDQIGPWESSATRPRVEMPAADAGLR